MITFLSGGTGTPKLIQGFRTILSDEYLSVIVNTADDIWLSGIYISPDVDTILYLFSGLLDENKFWGIKSDTFNTLKMLHLLGFPTWFNLGDQDLAVNLFRTLMIQKGHSQANIVKALSNLLNIKATVIPCTNNHIESRIITEKKGDIHFQEFWVKYKTKVNIKQVYIKNLENAEIPEAVRSTIEKSELIVIGPSNPVTSIGPIIRISEIAELLKEHKAKTIAISPIIGNKAVSGPTEMLMKAEGLEPTLMGIAEIYKDFCSCLIIDNIDSDMINQIQNKTGLEVLSEEILFKDTQDASKLACSILNRRGLYDKYV
ncbi:MAG: 2-phospho-L-lactate transferase [Candidatus Heimdallarchaeota archaeon]|nr:2-phospho-L-lactate transferase [Candidatus Heimdallarchaeota archaeon]